MTRDIDFDGARGYAIPMTTRFRGITVREGMLIEGPVGWGEFCPFADYDDTVSPRIDGLRVVRAEQVRLHRRVRAAVRVDDQDPAA